MAMRLAEIRRAVKGLSPRGRTTRVPEAVRECAVAYAQEQRTRGRSWRDIAAEVGLSASGLQRWAGGPAMRRPRLARVRIVAEPAVESARVSLVSPHGYRVEGLSLEQALRALGALG